MSKDVAKLTKELNLKIPRIRVQGEVIDLTSLTRLELQAMKAEYPGIVLDPAKEKRVVRAAETPAKAEETKPEAPQETQSADVLLHNS